MIATLMVLAQAAMPGSTIVARLESLLARTPLPREGEVAVITTTSADTVFVGQQIEILTTAWFPTAIRERLRRPPTLRPPAMQGVWSLPVVTLPGVTATPQVGESSYEIYASHQVVFPVNPGRLMVAPAELAFAGPGGRQFFGDERREERTSRERVIVVRPLPAAGQPPGFAGAVGRGMQVGWRVAGSNARVGDLLTVDLLVSGEGNLFLWGAPEVLWPAGVRVYTDRVDEAPGWQGARLAGTRRFRYLLLADSAGSLVLPELRYPHFDPLQQSYRVSTAPGMVVPILPSIAPDVPRATPPLLPSMRAAWPRRVVDRVPWPMLGLGVAVPILLAGALGRRWRQRIAGRRRPIAQALVRFEQRMVSMAGSALEGERAGVVRALRAGGIARDEAERAAALHAELMAGRYGPPGRGGRDESALAEAAAQWLHRHPRSGVSVLVLLAALGTPGVLAGQAPRPEALYADGAWEASAEAQRAVVAMDPGSPSAWYNLGAMRWMARQDAGAAAAWLEAYRLSPRNRLIRQAWSELALSHQQVRSWVPVVPITPDEAILAGLALLLIGGSLVTLRRGARGGGAVVAVAALLVLGGSVVRDARSQPQAVTAATIPLRDAPHGLAHATGTLDPMTLVAVEGSDGPWLLLRDARGRSGWVPAGAVARLRRLD